MLWQAKKTASGTYTTMPTPSDYEISWEDLDKNTYRAVMSGNLVRHLVSSKWFSGTLTFNYLTQAEAEQILDMINTYPLYVKIKSPLFGTNGVIEIQAYVSRASIKMERNRTNPTYQSLKFNIIQTKKVGGQ